MIWLIYEDYFKKKEKIIPLLKELKWYDWIIFLTPLLIAITLFYFSIKDTNWLFLVIYMFLSLISGGYIGYKIRKIKERKYGSEKDIYIRKIEGLKSTLKDFNITKKEQIDILLNQITETVNSLKVSEQIFKTLYSASTIVILPIILIFLKEFLTQEEYYGIAILIFAILIAIIGLWLMIKQAIEQVLDSQYKNMLELKQSLEDINISLLADTDSN